ncbi:hypothetical protein GCM10009540_62480 [Streptomyces turgidiscabies]
MREGLRLPHLRQGPGHAFADREGMSARQNELHRVHALPPSVPDALFARPPELHCPLPRVKGRGAKSQRKAEICGQQKENGPQFDSGE